MTDEEISDEQRLAGAVAAAVPSPPPAVVPWAESTVRFPSGVLGDRFKIDHSPWLDEPLARAVDMETRSVTLMKPVQTGGSSLGEVLLCYWVTFWRGFLQYNWSNDKRADERWESRVKDLLSACQPVARIMEQYGYQKGEFSYGRGYFRQQGVFNSDNLDSDSVSLQINEEVHAWEPGHLAKADGRLTAVWNYKQINISNAGVKEDQLDQKHRAGTMQEWEIICPGCRQKHRMRTKWDERRPQHGGLRYDADKARLGKFEYNYNLLRPTIRYQFPCGFTIHNEDMIARRELSRAASYSEPTNKGAETKFRSYTYDSVIVHNIDWMELIKQKHQALRARLMGNQLQWIKYTQERECIPYDSSDIPIVHDVKLIAGLKKNREGLPMPRLRAAALDRQQGSKAKGELPYWWAVIRDFKIFFGVFRSVLVAEGRFETDEQAVAFLDEHGCLRHQCVADSGDDTDHVYAFCLRYGINAIKGGAHQWYAHDNGARRTYSVPRPLCEMMNVPPKFPKVEEMDGNRMIEVFDDREPMFWLYSKGAIAERLHWMVNNTQYDTPDDVSEDYTKHHDAEERTLIKNPRDGSEVVVWVKIKDRNDLLVCERYCVMIFDMSGAMGECEIVEIITEDQTK
jgi:hypothetical protein